MTNSRMKALQHAMQVHFGFDRSLKLFQHYQSAFQQNYIESHTTTQIIRDIEKIEELLALDGITVDIRDDEQKYDIKYVRFYQTENPIALSDVLPILDNLGVRTISETTYFIQASYDKAVCINDFTIHIEQDGVIDLSSIKDIFEKALRHIVLSKVENDGFNKLIIHGCLSADKINIIRAYSRYLNQCKYRYTQTFVQHTLIEHVAITKNILNLFDALHNPVRQLSEANLLATEIELQLTKQLCEVSNIGHDTVIRRFILLIKSTLRTNFFQTDIDGHKKEYLTLKLNSASIPDLPLPKPLVDTFVYSSFFEGIHLRSSKVSRGGIRWSDRYDDYRTEVLGLMKAQKVKNSVIIPSGAKGGFILKEPALRQAVGNTRACVVQCYQQFIRGLLDVTDNIIDNAVVHPKDVLCHDDDDTYFVVAADKGTADLSDYANKISNEYSFWLGDAFASGGSHGYDHKKIGITARGAWESLKRHLQELDISGLAISVVGIGDMSGDVFGNGLIYQQNIKLMAAFDHRHIFIDPDPDQATSHAERLRLFQLKSSSWDDYSKSLLSTGGGIFNRSMKSIQISDEIKKALNISENELSSDQLICAILKAPVDVLYNGGIGTYVKSSKETSENVGDKTNEFCRVNANQLRCKIVCEGGNLGFTQLARVEYALNGGQINTDFIDNSGGVDCSDHEVNIKIVLNRKVNENEMTYDDRNILLGKMEQEVSDLVLHDNYYQALVLSYSSLHSHSYADLYIDHIHRLEATTNLDREVEHLPGDEELTNRKSAGKGLTKPELAVLLAYTKMHIKDEIIKSKVPDNTFFNYALSSSFPKDLAEIYPDEIRNHVLRREIISTQLSNHMLNTMGVTFPFRQQDETAASFGDICTAYSISAQVFDIDDLLNRIQSLDNKISVKLQYELLHTLRVLLNMSTRWFIRNYNNHISLQETVDYYHLCINNLIGVIPTLMKGSTRNYVKNIADQFISAGLPCQFAERIAISRVMYTALNIASLAKTHNFDLMKTAKLYFHIGGVFNLVWFRDALASDNRGGHRSTRARLVLRDDLDSLQRKLLISIMQSDANEHDIEKLTANWCNDHKDNFSRWQATMKTVMECQADDYTMLFITLRELSDKFTNYINEEKITLLAFEDVLTKLPNRRAILDKIEKLRQTAQRENTSFAVHFIDIDNFKVINDKYGHNIGDTLLIEVTKRLMKSVRSGDMVARHGGDEFIIIQTDVNSNNDAEILANKMLSLLKDPVYVNNQRLLISISIGISMFPLHGNTPFELITCADQAMYVSKRNGKNQYSVHEAVVDTLQL